MVFVLFAAIAPVRSAEQPGTVIDRWFAAYSSRSLESMLGLYAPDAVFEDVSQRHRLVGHESLRTLFDSLIGLHASMGVREKRRVVQGRTVVVEYEYVGTLSGPALSRAVGKEGCPDLDYAR
jgi:ketosteroid isomerase-like protein